MHKLSRYAKPADWVFPVKGRNCRPCNVHGAGSLADNFYTICMFPAGIYKLLCALNGKIHSVNSFICQRLIIKNSGRAGGRGQFSFLPGSGRQRPAQKFGTDENRQAPRLSGHFGRADAILS